MGKTLKLREKEHRLRNTEESQPRTGRDYDPNRVQPSKLSNQTIYRDRILTRLSTAPQERSFSGRGVLPRQGHQGMVERGRDCRSPD